MSSIEHPVSERNGFTVDADLLDMISKSGSAREIRRRTGLDHRFVAGFRAALAALAWSPPRPATSAPGDLVTGLDGLAPANVPPPSGTPSTPGHTVAFEPPALNSWDCWVRATPRERTAFVDAVGLHHLLAAAPAGHRDAFLKDLCRIEEAKPKAAVASLLIPADLSIPDFLRRVPR